jgi:hypothetical protein
MPDINTTFVQLPVGDVGRSRSFYGELGFEFDEMFSGDNSACVVVGEGTRLMLMSSGFFANLIPGKQIADAKVSTEAIVSFNLPDRTSVDGLIAAALAAGGTAYRETMDMGGMYVRAVQDPDGHVLEVFAMGSD